MPIRLLPPGDAHQEHGVETVISKFVLQKHSGEGSGISVLLFPLPKPLQTPAGAGNLLFRCSLKHKGDGCLCVTSNPAVLWTRGEGKLQ